MSTPHQDVAAIHSAFVSMKALVVEEKTHVETFCDTFRIHVEQEPGWRSCDQVQLLAQDLCTVLEEYNNDRTETLECLMNRLGKVRGVMDMIRGVSNDSARVIELTRIFGKALDTINEFRSKINK